MLVYTTTSKWMRFGMDVADVHPSTCSTNPIERLLSLVYDHHKKIKKNVYSSCRGNNK
jgi:hypothetical protein